MSKKTDALQKIDYFQKLSAAVFAVLAAVTAFVMLPVRYPLTVTHLTNDELASQQSTVFVSASRRVFDLPLWTVVVALLVIAAAYMLVSVTRWRKSRDKALDYGVNPWRWVYAGVTGALVIEILAILSGVHDLMVLKVFAGLMLLAAALGYVAERENKSERKPQRRAFLLSVAAGLLPWLVIATSAVATLLFSQVRSSWYVYALYAVTVAALGLMARNQWRHFQKKGQWKDYLVLEKNHIITSLVFKTLFVAILLWGLHK